jgi:SAM-dependent methyltransferase
MIGAIEKARSVILLAEGVKTRSLLEIGCGTGALLQRLDEAGFGSDYFAVEPSESRHGFLVANGKVPRLAASECSTFAASSLTGRRYDLVILSHVLEHVEDPAVLLGMALAVADHVIVEVPLEGQPAVSARMRLRARLTGLEREDNLVGHIQFYSRRDLEKLVAWCGGEIVRARTYVPEPQLQDLAEHGSTTIRLYARTVLSLSRLIGENKWASIYYGHHAMLIRKRPPRPESRRRRWAPSTFYGS